MNLTESISNKHIPTGIEKAKNYPLEAFLCDEERAERGTTVLFALGLNTACAPVSLRNGLVRFRTRAVRGSPACDWLTGWENLLHANGGARPREAGRPARYEPTEGRRNTAGCF